MVKFPENLYTDIRIESVSTTNITLENFELKQKKVKTEKGAIIRIYDGNRWYYASTTDVENIQKEVDSLAKMATPNHNLYEDPIVKRFEVNKEVLIRYNDESNVSKIETQKKLDLLNTYVPVVKEFQEVKMSRMYYLDNHTEKRFLSSKGADVRFDTQNCCVVVRCSLQENNIPHLSKHDIYKLKFNDLYGYQDEIRKVLVKDIEYCRNAVLVKPGVYTCVLSPVVTGVFAHESFGHKSEADFMVGDETMKKEWLIGKKVGANTLNIIDTGLLEDAGYVPFDDEGSKARENYIIKDGVLTGRLHSCTTAALLEENITGNARAMSFEYEPIVRMTCTYISAGKETKEELISGIEQGIYIDDLKHGSGMSTFTIAPSRAYMIRNGKIAEPVIVSVITGNVMKTLHEIDGFSNEVELFSFAMGGCGKMEQWPLRVGFGGPYIRVNGINVQ